jgi:hypothetical protein
MANQRPLQSLDVPREEQFFQATTPNFKVVAQPLDMPVDINAPLRNYARKQQQSAEFWSSINQGLNFMSQITEKVKAENERLDQIKGFMTAASGGTIDEKSSDAMLQGYYSYTAQIDMSVYNSAVQEYYAQHSHEWETPEDVEKGLENFYKEWIQARPTNKYYLETFLPKALNVHKAVIDTWTQEKVKQVNEDIYTTAVAGINSDVDNYVSGGLREFVGVEDLNVFLSDEALLKDYDFSEINEYLRHGLSQTQEKAKQMGMSRLDASEIYIKRLGEMAVKYGLPELLDFTSVKDESGISLDQTVFSDMINEYKTKASRVKDARIADYNERVESFQKRDLDLFYNKLYTDISQYVEIAKLNPQLALKQFSEYWENVSKDERFGQGDWSKHKTVMDLANKLLYSTDTFTQVDREDALADLERMKFEGSLNIDTLNEKLNNNEITIDTYSKYMRELKTDQEKQSQIAAINARNKGLARAYIEGTSTDEFTQLLNDPNTDSEYLLKYAQLHAGNLEKQQKLAEAQAKAQQLKQETAAAKQRQDTYLNFIKKFNEGEILTTDEIYDAYNNGLLDAGDAETLYRLVGSSYEDWKNEYEYKFRNETQSIIKAYAGFPGAAIYYPDFEYQLIEETNKLNQEFWKKHDPFEENLFDSYREEVIEKLKTKAQDLSPAFSYAQNTSNTLQQQQQNNNDKNFFVNLWDKLTNKDVQELNNLITGNAPIPQTSFNKDVATQMLETKGYEPEEASGLLKITAIENIKQRLSKTQGGIAGNHFVLWQLKNDLIAQGYTEAEADEIIQEALKSK